MNPTFSRSQAGVVAAATAILFSSTGHAAVITWGPAVSVSTGIGNSSDVSTNGTLVEAFNGAVSSYSGGDQTVNGVTFVATTSLLGLNSAVVTDFSIGTNGGDAAYDAILSTADFGGGNSTTITIGDGDGNSGITGAGLLKIGQLYEIQVWFMEDRPEYDIRIMGYGSSSADSIVSLDDQFAIGTFTADATTQTLFLDTVSPATGFGNTHITAYQIRLIPEPSVALLSALSA